MTMRQKGITLVELIISSSIAVVVGGLLLVVIVNSSGLFYKESSVINIGLNTNDALASVRNSIKESYSVAPFYVAGLETYTSGATTIVLKIPSLDSSGNIIYEVFDYFVIFLDQSKLRFKTFPDALSSRTAQDQILSNMADNLVFQYFNSEEPPEQVAPITAKKVRVTLTLKERSRSNYEASTATSEANLRND